MRIGLIGYGNMGSAIAERIKDKFSVIVFDADKVKLGNLGGMQTADNSVDLVNQSDVIILAVKPQDFDNLLSEIKDDVKGKLVISIAAGITTRHIEKILDGARVIRTMPNLPARVGAGMTCLFKGCAATDADLNFAKELFNILGDVQILETEELMYAATAISGSGPGFLFDRVECMQMNEIKDYAEKEFIRSLCASAENRGFSHAVAIKLAQATTKGSIVFLEQTGMTPGEAKKLVVSKKGTTEAGLEELHKSGSLDRAVDAAEKRARDLSKD